MNIALLLSLVSCLAYALPALIAVVVTLWGPLRVIFGLCERLFLITTNIWFILVSAFLVVKTI